ncbi:MAG: hypothetical protein EA424_16785 [Planctomycetaceae bacterium]|nr:MAG: hypothetical protein EA424_16785 [Planctomycetaceae bacterium]
MEHLQERLDQLLNQVPDADDIRTRLENLVSVYPFNEYEFIISHLRDTIKYWVQSSHEVENNPHYSKGQHRGNVGEGQLHLRQDNIRDFDKFQVKSNELRHAIIAAYDRERSQRS